MLLPESPSPESLTTLQIGPGQSFTLGAFAIEVTQFMGQCLDVYYFKVVYQPNNLESSPSLSSEVECQDSESIPQAIPSSQELSDHDSQCLGLLRVGQIKGGLQREATLRETLGNHRMVMPLVFTEEIDQVTLSLHPLDPFHAAPQSEISQDSRSVSVGSDDLETNEADSPPYDLLDTNALSIVNPNSTPSNSEAEFMDVNVDDNLKQDSDHLDDAYLEEEQYESVMPPTDFERALLTLSLFPNPNQTLAQVLEDRSESTLDSANHESRLHPNSDWIEHLSVVIQLCQITNYLHRQGWCWVNINPQWIELGKPICLYDFIGIFQAGDRPSYGISGNHWPPELLLGHAIDEPMVSFSIGAILYHLVHGYPPQFDPMDPEQTLDFATIPGLHQVLRACLAQGDDRPTITELLSMLVDLQQQFQRCRVDWIQGSGSTLGLSDSRWTNEDSYGVRYQVQSPILPTVMLGILADGMGGLEQGEVASQCAVQTLLTAPFPDDVTQMKVEITLDRWQQWLIEKIQAANQQIFRTIRNGGTTLSVVLGVADHLLIAHVGDSRIFLIRNGTICQLSEDHSLVETLWMTGQISYAEKQNHPDRNVILKSLGSSRQLPESDIQTLQQFRSEVSLSLQHGDILLLCSDGVWDLVNPAELWEIFAPLAAETDQPSAISLQTQIDQVLRRVLDRGAHDNATLLGLQCLISPTLS